MKKIFLAFATLVLLTAISCSNEVRKEKTNDTTMADSTGVTDTTKMRPDTSNRN